MNKKISMIKRLFIIVFILCYSFTSYSAVSVADGSSFVSKAEFSTDMNNLVNRISQMENSLDAKIDSLVSNYLMKNGIWNGATQKILTASYNYSEPSVTISASSVQQTMNSTAQKIFTSTKSGLVFINFSYVSTSSTGNGARWGYVPTSADNNYYSDHKLFLNILFVDHSKQSESLFVYELDKVNAQVHYANYAKTYLLMLAVPMSEIDSNAIFFVTKDKTYSFILNTVVVMDGRYNVAGTYAGRGNAIQFKMKKVTVY